MAVGVAGVDHPEEKAVVDIVVAGRGEMLMSWVEAVEDAEIRVTVAQNRAGQPVRLDVGERLDIVWKGDEELRSMPVELTATDRGEKPVWRLRRVGPAARGQRRGAVRSPLRVPVRVAAGGTEYVGETVDLSESGLRALLPLPKDPEGTAPDGAAATPPPPSLGSGTVVRVTVTVGDRRIDADAEIVRLHPREDRRPEVSVRFIGMSEYEQDLIRAHVFAQLRELRRRGLI